MAPGRDRFWIGWGLLYAGALAAAGNAIAFMTVDGFGGSEFVRNFQGAPLLAWLHIGGGIVAILLGPFQFIAGWRRAHPVVHRVGGGVYFAAVFGSALAGLYFAGISPFGSVTSVGFTGMATAWLVTAVLAIRAIRRGDIDTHRRWMTRNYAVTYAAATLRVELGLLLVAGLPFAVAFKSVAWASWLGNLAFVEAALLRRPAVRVAAQAPA